MRATKTAAYYISPIEIGVLWAKISYAKSHLKALGSLSPNRYEIDLSNEVLNIDFSQGAAKISEVEKNICRLARPQVHWFKINV